MKKKNLWRCLVAGLILGIVLASCVPTGPRQEKPSNPEIIVAPR